MKTLKVRFHVHISRWVTVERQVSDEFDAAKVDNAASAESDTMDDMSDEALCRAADVLDGEVDGQEVLP